MPDMAAAAPPLTFDDATRQNIVPLPTVPYAPGGTSIITLPTSGLGARLYFAVTGTVTGAPVVTATGPYSLFQRITIRSNSGVTLIDLSGYALYLWLATDNFAYDPGAWAITQGSSAATRNILFNYSATAINFFLMVPLAWNDRDDIGLVMLQNQRAQITVQITWNTVTGTPSQLFPYSGGTTPAITATLTPFLEFFTLPASPALWPNLLIAHSIVEMGQGIGGSGDQPITLLRGNTFTRIIHYLYDNNSFATAAANITKGVLRYDQNVRPYEINYQAQLAMQAWRYNRFLPDGTWVWPLDWQGIPGLGYFRDTIDSEAVSELTSILTYGIAPTAPNAIQTISDQLVHLEQAA